MTDTYGDMLDAIADETRRPRATFGAQISRCVREAIIEAEKETYWFNDTRTQTFATVNGQEYYGSAANSFIPYLTEIENLAVTISSGDVDDLSKASWDELQAMNGDGTTSGRPTHYAYAFKQIRLYPIPTAAYTVTIAGSYALADLSADADTNCWTVEREGGLLVRYKASALFYGTYLRLAERSATFENLANGEIKKLTASTSRRQATGRIRPCL